MEENVNKLHFLIASNFVIHLRNLQILIFSVLKIASLSPYWLQITLIPCHFEQSLWLTGSFQSHSHLLLYNSQVLELKNNVRALSISIYLHILNARRIPNDDDDDVYRLHHGGIIAPLY